MDFYTTIVDEMKAHPLEKEVEFAILHMSPLARALQENARRWVTSLGKLLRESAKDSLMVLNQQLSVSFGISYEAGGYNLNFLLQDLSQDLTRPPDTLEDLKFVLGVISNIRSMSLDVEMKYR
jgi:dynein heavy chain